MKPIYEAGDILIRRAANGWIAIAESVYDDGAETSVYSDSDNPECGDSDALVELLTDQFSCYLRSKRTGGMVITAEHTGTDSTSSRQTRIDFGFPLYTDDK